MKFVSFLTGVLSVTSMMQIVFVRITQTGRVATND